MVHAPRFVGRAAFVVSTSLALKHSRENAAYYRLGLEFCQCPVRRQTPSRSAGTHCPAGHRLQVSRRKTVFRSGDFLLAVCSLSRTRVEGISLSLAKGHSRVGCRSTIDGAKRHLAEAASGDRAARCSGSLNISRMSLTPLTILCSAMPTA